VLVGSLGLTAEGRFAWICYGGDAARVEVRKLDPDGPGLLDRRDRAEQSSDPIDIYSVAIVPGSSGRARGRVYWSSQAGPHSADLR
jgi:hypothetical protein